MRDQRGFVLDMAFREGRRLVRNAPSTFLNSLPSNPLAHKLRGDLMPKFRFLVWLAFHLHLNGKVYSVDKQ